MAFPEAFLDGCDDLLYRLYVLRVARQCVVRQRKTFTRYHQGQHDLLTVPAMVARMAPPGQLVLLRQALEITAR